MHFKLTLLVVILLTGFSIKAQKIPLTVTLSTEKKDTVNEATIQLYASTDTVPMAAQKFTSKGNAFYVAPFASYRIKVSAIGYHDEEFVIAVKDKALKIPFYLKKNETTLSGVVVTSKKPLLKQEDDKTIVDATILANSSTNAYEVLEKTPGAIVDQDGNVYLSSNTPATIYINGREMKLGSSDIASLLKSLPAGSISKIEMLRTPSAKYDAASSGGIVNIVLKKGVKLGSSGSANLAWFQGVYATKTAGVNINKSGGKINSYFSYQFTDRNNYEDLQSDRSITTDSSLLKQKSSTTYPSVNNYFGAGIDMAVSKKTTIGYDLRLSNNNGKTNGTNFSEIYKNPTQPFTGQNQSDIYNKYNSFFITNTLSSKYKIDTIGSEWSTEIDYNYYKNDNVQTYNNYSIVPVRSTVFGKGDNKNDKNIFVAQTDLTLKLPKKITLESGFKATISNSNSSSTYFFEVGNNGSQVDPYQTNTFKYREAISATYLQLAKTFYGFTLKPGLRLETTDINGRQLIPRDTSLSIKRTDLFPYLYVRHKLFSIFGTPLLGSAIYRRSIKRPYYEILNPYPKYVDQYLFDVGNPRLQPQLTTNYELNAFFNEFPVFAVGLNKTNNIFSSVTYQDDVTKIAYRTYDNLGSNKELYFKVVGGIPPGGKYFCYVGTQYNLNKYDGVYQNLPLHYTRGSWLFFMYHELKVSKTLIVDIQGFMRTKAVQNFYELDNFGALYLSANKSIFKKKANLIFSINDALKTNQVSFNLSQGTVNATGKRINDTRRFGITLRYNFGLSKPKENKDFGVPVDSKEN